LFEHPPGMPLAWVTSDTYRTASRIPGVTAIIDSAGVESDRFGALTSGQALLFDRAGKLAFSGGSTGARGRPGPHAGENAVVAAVNSGAPGRAVTPVYGCPLKSPGDKSTKERRTCPTS